MNTRWIIASLLAALILGGLIGFLLGRQRTPDTSGRIERLIQDSIRYELSRDSIERIRASEDTRYNQVARDLDLAEQELRAARRSRPPHSSSADTVAARVRRLIGR